MTYIPQKERIMEGLASAIPTYYGDGPDDIGRLYYATDTETLYRWDGDSWEEISAGGSGSPLTVKEQDGTPSVSNVTEIRVSNNTLTDEGGGVVSITTGGGSGPGGGLQTLTDGPSIAWDLSSGSGVVTLGGNRELANPTNMTAGEMYFLKVIQDGTGNRTLDYGSAYYWGSVRPTLSTAANAVDLLVFACDGTRMMEVSVVLNYLSSSMPVPQAIPGLLMWLKADAITGLNDGDAVTSWSDSSGNSVNASQATAARKPLYKTNIINSLPVVRFDGTDDTLSINLSLVNSMTIAMVCSPTTGTDDYVVAGDGSSGSPAIVSGYSSGTNKYEWFNTATNRYLISNTATGINLIVVMQVDGVSNVGRINGAQVYSNTPSVAVNGKKLTVIGGLTATTNNAGVDIAEILVFSRLLSNRDLEALESYIRAKYAIW
jgi:hypothetical protein